MNPHDSVTAALAFLAIGLGWLVLRLRREKKEFESEIRAWKLRLEIDFQQARQERDRLLDALNDAFLLVDARSIIRFANRAAYDLFDGRELVGREVREVFLDPRMSEALLHCIDTGEALQSRVVLPQQTSPRGDAENRGTNAWIVNAAPLSDTPDGDPTVRVIIRDVTSEHHTEQIRKDFVANASHELRTPLAIIQGYLENLLDGDLIEDHEVSRRFLTIMGKHTERITRIVEDMLVISRLESGEAAALKTEPFRIRSCINDVLERLESVIHARHAEVVIASNTPDLRLHGDRFYWTQVLFNLIENALKQNPHRGLRIEVGYEREDNDGARLWIADNGVGIPSADLPHIFRRFYRVEKHHSQQEIKGTGLGLSIVKRAIEAHGGRIGVTSVPGQETRFTIELPASSVVVN